MSFFLSLRFATNVFERVKKALTDRKVSEKGMLLVGVPLMIELVILSAFVFLWREADYAERKASETKNVIAQANKLTNLIIEGSFSLLAFGMTRSQVLGARYDEILSKFPGQLKELKKLVANQPDALDLLDRAEKPLKKSVSLLAQAKEMFAREQSAVALMSMNHIRSELESSTDEWLLLVNDFIKLQQKKAALDPRTPETIKDNLKTAVVISVLLNIGVAIGMASIFSSVITERLNVLTDNTHKLAGGAELNPPLTGKDEFSTLDHSFHEMADALSEAAERLKASEMRLQSLIDAMPVGLITFKRDGSIVSGNPRAIEIFRHESIDRIVGSKMTDFIPPDAFETLLASATNLDASFETMAKTIDENEIPIEIALTEFDAEEGEEQFLANIQDITARHDLEELKREFVSMISHDLRTPLTSLRLTLQMFGRGVYGELDKKGTDRLEAAEESVERLISLINQLLDLDKLEAGMMEVKAEAASVMTIMDKSVESLRAFAEQHDVNLESVETDLYAMADSERIMQVLVNLISNAIKFSPPNRKVTVLAQQSQSEVMILVKDQGRGIPPHLLDRIFERFKQVDRSDASVKKGTGLGLAISRAIVEAHGGRIGVDSKVGEGSTFWFTLAVA